MTLIQPQALKKQLTLELKLPSQLADVFMDERRMRQVLINLLNNAVKFTPEKGKITLEVNSIIKQQGQQNLPYLRFAVKDTGIGIAPENIGKLFQPFVQIDSALNRKYAGTGLGLVLVKQIVELHGGDVGVTSKLGVGSCFTLEIKSSDKVRSYSPQQEILPESNSVVVPTENKGSPLILLVEDNEANINTITSYLTAKGYRLITAQNGKEALALVQSATPDLILMDVQIPDMDGLEIIKQIRLHSHLLTIPIIALTALAMKGDRQRCLAAGANDYMSKPVKLKQLTTKIQEYLVK